MAWGKITEFGTQVNVASNHLSPERTTTFFNPKMSKNRMLVLCALTATIKQRGRERVGEKIQRRIRCLDAFGATGIMGLQWKVHHHDNVLITVSDTNPESVSNIRKNCTLNNILAHGDHRLSTSKKTEQIDELVEVEDIKRDDEKESDNSHEGRTKEVLRIKGSVNKEDTRTGYERSNEQSDDLKNGKRTKVNMNDETQSSEDGLSKRDETLTLACCDANLVMRQRFFDFIHLDPYGCATPFMDSAFSNISNNGILSITSTDTAALYGKCPQVTLRNYGGRVAKCEYLKELAGRLIIAAAVRAAARCNKGLEVLLCVALEHFVLVILRVRRGSGQADRSVQEVKNVLHCQVCGQRTFVSTTLTVPSSMYDHLSCTCHKSAPGNTAILLGPVWSGSIYDAGFIDGMVHAGLELSLDKKDLQLLRTLLEEATCSGQDAVQMSTESPETKAHPTVVSSMETGPKRRRSSELIDETKMQDKRRRCNESSPVEGQPAFYFSLPQHSIKNMDNPRIKRVIECLQAEGYQASRTHFDPEGVRTSAGLAHFKAVLQDNSTPTMKTK